MRLLCLRMHLIHFGIMCHRNISKRKQFWVLRQRSLWRSSIISSRKRQSNHIPLPQPIKVPSPSIANNETKPENVKKFKHNFLQGKRNPDFSSRLRKSKRWKSSTRILGRRKISRSSTKDDNSKKHKIQILNILIKIL